MILREVCEGITKIHSPERRGLRRVPEWATRCRATRLLWLLRRDADRRDAHHDDTRTREDGIQSVEIAG
jgi:hypothetical protein